MRMMCMGLVLALSVTGLCSAQEQAVPGIDESAPDPASEDCVVPGTIDGGMLVRFEPDGIVHLGWWSHCEEGNFIALPLTQDGVYENDTIYTPETGHADLLCHRMSDELVATGMRARYACGSQSGAFDFLHYYDIPREAPTSRNPSETDI